jgi:lipopolysaccharide export system protein LptA
MTAPLLLLLALSAQPAPAAPGTAPARPPAPAAPGPRPANPLVSDADKQVPTKVDADVIRYNWTTRKVIMQGKPFVTLTRDDLTLTCRRMVGDNDAAGRLAYAVCEGDVKLVRGTRVVTCERGQYDRDAARIICDGNPVLRDGETEVSGKRLTYLIAADEVLLEEAVQATVPGTQLEQIQRKPSPAAPGKPTPAPPRAAPAPPRAAPPAPARPAGGGP